MVYLIVGVDRSTYTRWHDHVMASDAVTAEAIAQARAAAQGVQLAVAAAIGPNSSIATEPVGAGIPRLSAARRRPAAA
jgi:hypothetical protein